MIASGNTTKNRARLADLIDHAEAHATVGEPGLDETLEADLHGNAQIAAEVIPHAHKWHLKNEYIPLEVIRGLADLGVFGLTIPEEFGGMGLFVEDLDVRCDGRIVARLYRRRLARHAA